LHSDHTKTLPKGKLRLAEVLRQSGDLVRAEDVTQALQIDRSEASRLLARWTKQGMLRRVSRGLYAPVSIEFIGSEHVLTDPWILAPELYNPCYIGGRTAAEYWDLTEQIFRDIVILTSATIRSRSQRKHGTTFTIKKVSSAQLFGTTTIWRSRTKVMISDLHKTVIDMISYPELGGGIQHVTDCLKTYFSHDNRDVRKLFDYAKQTNNGAVFKRLGYLVDSNNLDSLLADACLSQLTTGLAKLDPNLACPRIVSKWRLRIPELWNN
jgi:predicted transcriptional regulator of viral defense system